jgi:hypothetical protein
MTKIGNNNFSVEMQINAIELLESSMTVPTNSNQSVTNFNFNVSIESKADATNKLIFVIVSAEVKNDDHSFVLGTIRVSCIYSILNFEEMIKTNETGNLEVNPTLVDILNSISISTTRGVMFSTFKGTFLHAAVLPVIDPKQFHLQVEAR